MNFFDKELTGEETLEELLDIYDSSVSKFVEGQVVTGSVISVGRESVLVDLGHNCEGMISIHEFIGEDGNVSVNVGDEFEVMIEVWDEVEETVLLSRDKAQKLRVWDAIKDIYDADGSIEGVITSRVKGGFSVDIGLTAFLPGSQASLGGIKNMDELVGRSYNFKVLEYNRKRNNIVISRRAFLESDSGKVKNNVLVAFENNQIIDGIITDIKSYGVFVDIGDIEGFIRLSDMTHNDTTCPLKNFSVGDKVSVKIATCDLEKKRIVLNLVKIYGK